MPLPSFICSDVEDEVCCEGLFRWGIYLAELVATPLAECVTPGGCYGPALETYVSFSDASTWCCDTIGVSFVGIGATAGSALSLQTGLQGTRVGLTAQWAIRLMESCYPTLEDEGTPSPKEYHFVNRHLYAHGEMMLRAIQKAHEQKALHPAGCASSALRSFSPLPVLGNCVGWEARIEVTIDWRDFWTP